MLFPVKEINSYFTLPYLGIGVLIIISGGVYFYLYKLKKLGILN
jgi:hypothetical protein